VVLHSPGCGTSLEEGAFTYCRISRQIPPLPLLSLSPLLFSSSLIFIQSKTQLDSLSQRLLEVTPLTHLLTFLKPSRKTLCTTIAPLHHALQSSYTSHSLRQTVAGKDRGKGAEVLLSEHLVQFLAAHSITTFKFDY
jgi:hypothetical protein